MKQLAARTKFQDDVIVLPRLGEVDELDDIGVVELTHDLHFFEDVCSLLDRDVSDGHFHT